MNVSGCIFELPPIRVVLATIQDQRHPSFRPRDHEYFQSFHQKHSDLLSYDAHPDYPNKELCENVGHAEQERPAVNAPKDPAPWFCRPAKRVCNLPLSLVRARLAERFTLEDITYRTGGPARYVRVKETGGRLGFITPLTHAARAATGSGSPARGRSLCASAKKMSPT
jgi:hypothetical protein